jgi:hypothetical protein
MVFFPKVLDFFLAITNILEKSWTFSLRRDFKIQWQVFIRIFICLNLFQNIKIFFITQQLKIQVKGIDLNINKGSKVNEFYPSSSELWERNLYRNTYSHKVLIYREHHSVCPLVGIGTPPPL